MGITPSTTEDTRRWVSVYNAGSKEIPPFGTVFCFGKRFVGDEWDETHLPDVKGSDGKSYDDLQQEVGYGNLLLIIADSTPIGTGSNAGVFHNGPTAIAKGSWGKVTRDYPTIARIELRGDAALLTEENRQAFVRYQFLADQRSPNLIARLDVQGGLGLGYGFGGSPWGASGFNPESTIGWGRGISSYSILDLVDVFTPKEGLAWVAPGYSNVPPTDWEIDIGEPNTELTDDGVVGQELDLGVNYLSMTPRLKFTQFTPTKGRLYWKDDVLNVCVPGLFVFDLRLGFTSKGNTTLASGEHPWSRLVSVIETEDPPEDFVEITPTGGESRVRAMPRVLKQGFDGDPCTYVNDFAYADIHYECVIPEPEGWDPSEENLTVLCKFKLKVLQTSNATDEMSVIANGTGSLSITELSLRSVSSNRLQPIPGA